MKEPLHSAPAEDLQPVTSDHQRHNTATWPEECSTTGQVPTEGRQTTSPAWFTGAKPMSEPVPLTALECFDKRSVKILSVVSVVSCLVFLVVNIVTVSVDDNMVRRVVWCIIAWPTMIWSYFQIIGWECKAAPKLNSLTETMEISPEAAVYTFRALFWGHLVSFTIGVLSNTLLIFHCAADEESFVTQKCVQQDGPMYAWRCLLFSINCCYLSVSVLVLYIGRLSAAHTHKYATGFKMQYWINMLITLISFGLIVLGACRCDFERSGVFDNSDKLKGWDQIYEACPLYYLCETKYALRLYAWVWFAIASCNFKDTDGVTTLVPRWVILMSGFLGRAVLPATLVESVMPGLVYTMRDSGGVVSSLPLYPLLSQAIFNFYLFGMLPPGVQDFLCLKLSFVARNTAIPWEMARRGWEHSWDAYYDDPSLDAPTASGVAPRAWTRKAMLPEDMRFVSCNETDTHAQFARSQDGEMLVIAFRGTGSLKNIGTDCSVSRTQMHCSESGLVFENEDALQSTQRVVRAAKNAAQRFIHIPGSVMVHGGFSKAYLSVREELLSAHATMCAKKQPSSVLVTGHSLGGALATLFTMELLAQGLHTRGQVWMITLGQPRVGNTEFAELFESLTLYGRSFRIVYKGDLIAGIPKFIFLFKHVGIEVEITDKGQVLCNPSPLEHSMFAGAHSNPASHSMNSYDAGLVACVKRFCDNPEQVLTVNEEVSDDTGEKPSSKNDAGVNKCAKCGVRIVDDVVNCFNSGVCQACRDVVGMI